MADVGDSGPTRRARLIAAWGVLSVTLVLGQAIARLTPWAVEPWVDGSMTAVQKGIYVAFFVVNGYAEGYRAFQKKWCPRVVQRAFHLGAHPRLLHVLLAPFFCMSLFHASRRGLTLAWTVVGLVAVAVIVVRLLPQPWRGIIDGGVVIGLVWGVVSLWICFARWVGPGAPPPPDLPVSPRPG